MCEINGIDIEIIDHSEKSKEAELTDDLIQIITVFANRLYGQRSKKTKKLIDEVKTVIVATKIKLKPTKEQEILFWKSAGVPRWSYNYFLAESNNCYNENKKSLKDGEVRKHINNVLKKTTHTWLKEVGSNVMKQGVKDANLARDRWFKELGNKAKFKSR